MQNSLSISSNNKKPSNWSYFIPGLVIAYQIIAIIVFIISLFLAKNWLRLPYIGALTDPNLVLNQIKPSQGSAWVNDEEFRYGNQIVQADDVNIKSTQQLDNFLNQHTANDNITLTLRTPDGKYENHDVVLQIFPNSDRIKYLYIPIVIGLIYLFSSFWVFVARGKDGIGQMYSIFTTSVAISLATLFDLITSHRLAYLWVLSITLAGGALINLSLVFPQEDHLIARFRFLRWVGFVPAILLAIFSYTKTYDFSYPLAYVFAMQLEYIFVGLSILIFIGRIIQSFIKHPSPIVHEQARLVLLGSVLSFIPIGLWLLVTVLAPKNTFNPYFLLFLIFFPVTVAFSILRYRWLNADYIVSRAALYGSMIIIAVVGYGLLVTGFTLVTSSIIQADNLYFIGGTILVFALLLHPLRESLQSGINTIFSRGRGVYRTQLQTFSRELTQSLELPIVIGLLRQIIQNTVAPSQFHIYVYDALSEHYIASPENGTPDSPLTSEIRFTEDSSLAILLSNRRTALFFGDINTLPAALQSEHARLALLGAQLFIPLPGRKKLAGWLALGPRSSGSPYTNYDVEYLESVCDQAALAVERSQVVADLERRIHEMNVLTRVSQGINITIAFDDMLELIYAQTSQVLLTRDLWITLRDTYSDMLYHVFYLENDERLSEKENLPLHIGEGLEQEVVKSRRPIVTDDYDRECQNRGVLPSAQEIFAWLGVPLNAGAETIGVLSLGNRDPSVSYTREQVNLLQAVADQAAAAIVKSRLLQEAERRTHQLTTLNEVARSLTSTLELDPLLNQILNSAVEILNCEAGSLLLVDETSGELSFEVVAGPPESANLLGQRLPPGTGLVGKTVETRQPIIVNDVRRAKDWFEKTDQQTGFQTKDLLVVPMQVKENVIGVIEVINRKDHLPFNPDDQELLSAFTSQAAIAIDNARLYTQTDQTLTARVEELSVMQRIDRELNASLDVSRAMHITLDWAMRQSNASAGLVGMMEENGLRVMASQGYTSELAEYTAGFISGNLPALEQTIQTGLQHSRKIEEADSVTAILAGAKVQVVIPIRREGKVIGIILLESSRPELPPQETIDFLSRLSDHAAISIANAQLYAEVQAANLAKSQFVSLVAHELKNPMTSIRGFTDLLAKGAVGPINETQVNFLSTIRSNVERMNTIVVDLNDLTKIEIGSMRLEFKPVQIAEVIEEVTNSIIQQIHDKHQKLIKDLQPNLPTVWADRTRINQILTNLVSNAYKYTPEGGQITIGGDLTHANPNDPGSLKVVHLWIQDTGIGIPPEDQAKVFQQYFRTDASKDMASGTGLGLNITKSLVEMQGGRIWFESESRKGTTFHFTTPIAETA
jgi:signal transduction histidine kinase